MGSIYLITNNVNNKVYVGKTIQSIALRWKRHRHNARHNSNASPHLYAAMRKYGVESFRIECIGTAATNEDLNALEQHWIAFYKSRQTGYNLRAGGEGGPHSSVTRHRMSVASRHIPTRSAEWLKSIPQFHPPLSPERKESIRQAMLGNKHRSGKKHSAATRLIMRAVHTGITHKVSEQGLANMRAGQAGKTISVETRAKMSIAQKARRARG
jgi:group I intron endonuclease